MWKSIKKQEGKQKEQNKKESSESCVVLDFNVPVHK